MSASAVSSSSASPIRVASIEVDNIMGTRHAAFKPGTLTTLQGANGECKTSILQGIARVFIGGHDPTVLRRGAKVGQALLGLSNGATIKMRVTDRSTTYEVTDEHGNEVRSPRAYIEDLATLLAVDPARLLLAKPRELADLLLEVMPITFTYPELTKVVSPDTWALADHTHSLDEIEAIEKQMYEARTKANSTAKEAHITIKSLRAGLPDQEETDWAGRVKELKDLLQEARQAREAAIKEIERKEREGVEEIKAEAQRKIDALKEDAKRFRTATDVEYEPDLTKIATALGEAEERVRDRDRAEGIRQSIGIYEQRATQAAEEAAHFTVALEGLTELKREKQAQMPIAGLEVREGMVYLDNIPFERVNLAERIKVCFEIAALRSGKLSFMLLDQAEALDPETWTAFKAGAIESGFQVIAARVSEGPLSIEIAA